MEASIFNVLNEINRQGLDNQYCGFCDLTDVFHSTKEYFGTIENIEITGQYLYIYGSNEDLDMFTCYLLPRQYNIMNLRDSNEKLLLIKL